MRLITTGATRWVLLFGNYAVKFPRPTHYRNFLQGILGNDQELEWSRAFNGTRKLCPVLWCGPLRLILVMPRCAPMTDEDFPLGMDEWRLIAPNVRIPVEMKASSFGRMTDGRMVAIDYGS